ncbi:MAG TPA: LysR family transcriptional regulator [Brevibacterium senegalense]|uniref:LysR family transcriptional regulator n=1 Tax=Brevibacterium senegalense TaxID=1033736 RepID=A0A921MCZ7_9MICO|nr:LysR family transcriptional regulator [Brevibacterium senegalense]
MQTPDASPAPAAGAGLRIAPDDLLALLAVARLGKYTAAAASMGVNHTTVSRRIAALEKAVGDRVLAASPDGWELTARGRHLLPAAEAVEAALASASQPDPATAKSTGAVIGTVRVATTPGFANWVALPAIAELQRQHPGLQVEITTVTQPARRYRSGVDIEVVVGRPDAPQSLTHFLRPYSLGLFATEEYLETHGTPQEAADMADHRLIYYPEHSVGVAELAHATQGLPEPAGFLRSNSVRLHVHATVLGMGVGLLPTYMGDTWTHGFGPAVEAPRSDAEAAPTSAPRLVRVLPDFERRMEYWAAVRPEALRSNAVEHVFHALRRAARAM